MLEDAWKLYLTRSWSSSKKPYIYCSLFTTVLLLCYNYITLSLDTSLMGTLSPIGGLINVNSNIAATYHNQPTSKPSPKPSNVTTSHTHKLLDNPHRINLTTLNYNPNISDVEYFSIFNSRSNNSKLPFNDKVSQIVAKKNVKEETFANIINSAKTKVKIPSYFIDNYLINLLDDPHHERHSLLTEELQRS